MRFLSRFLTPILLLGAAAYVWWHNSQGEGIIALMFLERLFPDLAGDPVGLGRLTVGILAAVGGFTAITALLRTGVRRRRDDED